MRNTKITTPSRFPRELLEQSDSAKLDYFRRYTIGHPKLKEAFETLKSTLKDGAPGRLIFIIGPTGAGKTTLRLITELEMTNNLLGELQNDSARFPIIGLQAISPETGTFNWKDFFKRILMALAEPGVDEKICHLKHNEKSNFLEQFNGGARASGAELRYVIERILKVRRPMAILIDDAQHIAKVASGKRIQDQLDCIKSLADITQIPFVLFGTYELHAFRNLSAQLSRRSIDIHLWRYRSENPEDIKAFKNVLSLFQRHLPIPNEPNLVDEWDYFYERSIGCIGVLKDWLNKALVKALKDKELILRPEYLKKTQLSIGQCEKMLADAIDGENKLNETEASRLLFRKKLGLETNLSCHSPVSNSENTPCETTTQATEKNPVGRKKDWRPGQRKPKRDRIGNL
jgi:hypothetical protein